MDLRRLRAFVTLAEELHFSRAAQRLQISQSTLSARVSELESELGTRLFERSTRRVALTLDGERLLGTARTALAVLDDAADAVRAAPDSPARLRVAVSPAARGGIIEAILDHYEASPSAPTVSLREGASRALLRDLAGFRLDLCITFCESHPAAMPSERLAETQARVSLRAEDTTSRGAVKLTDLAHLPLVLLSDPDSAGYNEVVLGACGAAGLDPTIVWIPRHGSREAFWRSGGYTFVVPWAKGFSDGGMVSLEIAGPAPVLHLDLVWRDDDSAAVASLLQSARAMRDQHRWMAR